MAITTSNSTNNMAAPATASSTDNTCIPAKCTVLIIGGGPGGSYAASVLAREGIDTVLLEAEVFPRYHIGESMLGSLRHFLKFIDLYETFDNHGFKVKTGAAFKLNASKREGYTDFIASGGPENYTWNVVRSESDELMFRHAGKMGAKIFDGVKVNELIFAPLSGSELNPASSDLGRPVSASYTQKATGETGAIEYDYLIDASGRAGLLNTKYRKNRTMSKALKNVATWGYWKNATLYGGGTSREDAPFFEALTDESGWAWLIPLHNGTSSVGVVQNQELSIKKKKMHSSTEEFYHASLKLAPQIAAYLDTGELVTEIKSGSDFSYRSDSYAMPYARVVGDAGCFIDPFFSSGMHLALAGALSAATTICASIRGDCDEIAAGNWHTKKIADGYQRFKLVVLSAYRQMRSQDKHILSNADEDNFDFAFDTFRNVIQGTADIKQNVTKADEDELEKMLDFCAHAFNSADHEERVNLLQRVDDPVLNSLNGRPSGDRGSDEEIGKDGAIAAKLTAEEEDVLNHIRARKFLRTENPLNIEEFRTDVINGMTARMERGKLGLNAVV